MIPRVQRALFHGTEVLESLGLRYAAVGGLAVGVWATPRATRDVDLYADLPETLHKELFDALTARGFEVPAMEEELARFGVFRSKLVRERVFLDIFDAVGPLGESIIERRQKVTTGGRDIWFASAEDVALLKAFSDRPRDHDDLVALLSVSRGLDASYLDRWVKVLDESIGGTDVSERLSLARREAERNWRHGH